MNRALNRALWHVGPGRAELRPEPEPEGPLALRALASGLSRGTERLVHRGRVPPALRDLMRGPHQGGSSRSR